MVIVAAEPPGEFDQVGSQKPCVIENRDHRLQLVNGCFAETGDDPNDPGSTKRYLDTRANLWLGEMGGKRIVEDATQGPRYRDLNDGPGHNPNRSAFARQLAKRVGHMSIK